MFRYADASLPTQCLMPRRFIFADTPPFYLFLRLYACCYAPCAFFFFFDAALLDIA